MHGHEHHKIFLVDDHPTVRRGIRELIQQEPHLEVVGEVGSAERALHEIRSAPPDLVVVDLSMDGMTGFELIQRLKAMMPELPIVVVSIYKNPLSLRRARESGADGYVSKDLVSDLLLQAIERALDGQKYFPTQSTTQTE